MKIKMMDLFKLMLERKAPKKIKVLGVDMTFIETAEWGDYNNDNGYRLSEFRLIDCLNEDVEIIEEPKQIEKLPYYSLKKIQQSKSRDEWYENRLELLEKRINDYHNKINEIIDEINNLKEND